MAKRTFGRNIGLGLCLLFFFIIVLHATQVSASAQPVYSFVIRETDEPVVTLNLTVSDIAFTKIMTNVASKVGTTVITYYKLSREPISKFSLAKKTYQYVTLESNNTFSSSSGVSTTIYFTVSSEWMSTVGANPEDIYLYLYDEQWVSLPTTFVSRDSSGYTYRATSKNLGNFAIAMERSTVIVDEAVVEEEVPAPVVVNTKIPKVISAKNATQASQTSPSNSSNSTTTTEVVLAKKPVEVVYPYTEEETTNVISLSSPQVQKWIGIGLLIFSCTGMLVIGTSFIASRQAAAKKTIFDKQEQGRTVTSMIDSLQKSLHASTAAPQTTSNVHDMLSNMRKKYNTSISTHPVKDHNLSSIGASLKSMKIDTTLEELKAKVSSIEPDIVKRYASWGQLHGQSIADIKKELLSHDIEEDVIDRTLASMK
ncbi:MAG TPA: PGF-pre-PGF domain-containing protein [Acidobacteriota bacterium]|nr:PGF-pre-PGF domain-containing protein [Acidobacteriota bacterium]